MKKVFLTLIATALLAAGLGMTTYALYSRTLTGKTTFRSGVFTLKQDSYNTWDKNKTVTGIYPGDSGIINVGATLDAEVATLADLTLNIPAELSEIDFYLVTKNGHVQLQDDVAATIDTALLTSGRDDIQIQWIYDENATTALNGTVSYTLEVTQDIESERTFYTNVWYGSDDANEGTYENIQVTYNPETNEVSFTLPIGTEGKEINSVVNDLNDKYQVPQSTADGYPDGINIKKPIFWID